MTEASTAEWLQLTLRAREHSTEQLEDALLEAGAVAVTLAADGDEEVLEPAPGETPTWRHTRVTGLFAAHSDIQSIKRSLCRTLHSDTLPECCMGSLEERDWVRAWMDDFHPMRFGRRLWVCPSTATPPDASAVTVFLDPGLAFGSGTHPTTALCLEWLDGAELTGRTVIDYGCGSGILAIAAAALGATRVWGVDIDSQALFASDQNAAANAVSQRIVLCAPQALPTEPVDCLLANILAGPLMALAPHFAALVKPGGALVLSGILADQVEDVTAAFRPWFDLKPPRQREEWALLAGTRRAGV